MVRRLDSEELPAFAEFLKGHFPHSLKDQYQSNTFGVFSLDGGTLSEILETPGIVDWTRPCLFGALSATLLPNLEGLAGKYNFEVNRNEAIDMYLMEDQATEMRDPPDGMTIGELSTEHARVVNDSWDFKSGNKSLSYIQKHIEHFHNAALFDRTGTLVAWELTMFYGSTGILYVLPEHRRKGYARYLTGVLARKLLDAGQIPYTYVLQKNQASARLHETVGFIRVSCESVSWTKTVPKNAVGPEHY